MLTIPILVLYMDAADNDKWIVIDGLQRLNNIRHFVLQKDTESKRMADRECVLRFLAFVFLRPELYPKGDLDVFLHKAMDVGNRLSPQKTNEYEARFCRAMNVAHRIFRDKAFRKYYGKKPSHPPISRPLFDTVSVNIDSLTHEQQEVLVQRRSEVNKKMAMLFREDKDFDEAIYQGSASGSKRLRYHEILSEE